MSLSDIQSPEQPRLVAEPELLAGNKIYWGGMYATAAEAEYFPYHTESQTRYNANPSDYRCFPGFVKASEEARERIWIVDKHFNDEMGFFALQKLLAIVSASDVRIISQSKDSNSLAELNQTRKQDHLGPVYWLSGFGSKGFDYAHDRFAIVDLELWHFGATVGGAHKGLQAASRGWSASQCRAIAFFKELWQFLGGPAMT